MNELLNNGLLIPEWTTPSGKATQTIKYGRGIGLKTTLTPEIATQIAANYYGKSPADRLSQPQLAKKYGIGRSTVGRILKEYRESQHIKSSLHSKETLQGVVADFLARKSLGLTTKTIAERYNLSVSGVQRIIHRSKKDTQRANPPTSPAHDSLLNLIKRTAKNSFRITLRPDQKQIPVPVDLAPELWRPMVGFEEKYQVSSKGKVGSLSPTLERPHLKGKLLKSTIINSGYEVVHPYTGKHRSLFVHRLVAAAFVPNPRGVPYVNHKDSNRLNNTWQNLEWVTGKENAQHAIKYGEAGWGRNSTIPPDIIAQLVAEYYGSKPYDPAVTRNYLYGRKPSPLPTYRSLAAKYNIHREVVARVIRAHQRKIKATLSNPTIQ